MTAFINVAEKSKSSTDFVAFFFIIKQICALNRTQRSFYIALSVFINKFVCICAHMERRKKYHFIINNEHKKY